MSDHDHEGEYSQVGHSHQVDEVVGASDYDHDHEGEYASKCHDHEEFDDQAAELNDLRDQVGELERDRAAMIRRMRLLEEALSLTPPAEFLTAEETEPEQQDDRLAAAIDKVRAKLAGGNSS